MAHPLDSSARQRGFPDYPTMAAFYRNRAASLQGQPAPAAQPQNNFLQSLLGAIPVHPSHLLTYVNNRYRQATGQR